MTLYDRAVSFMIGLNIVTAFLIFWAFIAYILEELV
jgi:hypothetical protein